MRGREGCAGAGRVEEFCFPPELAQCSVPAVIPLRHVPAWAAVLGNKLTKVKLPRLEQRDTGSHLIFVTSVIKPYLVVVTS